MTAPPPMTVAIPTIGRMDYLPSLLASLEAQTMGDFEALILDNASPDDARDLFADQARRDSRFRTLRLEERIPMFSNFNRAWLEMRGRYLAYFHDDDVYAPRFLEAHRDLLDREPKAAFSGCNNDFIDPAGSVTERRRWIEATGVMPGREFIEFVLSRGRNLLTMQGVAYRKEALAPRGIDDTLSCHYGDFVIMMRMAERGDVGLISEPLVSVRRHPEQFSVKGWRFSEAFELRTRMLEGYVAEYESRWPGDERFLATMRAAVTRSTRVGSVWGWLNASDRTESTACLEPLRGSLVGAAMRATLLALEGIGLDSRTRQSVLAPWVRHVGNSLRL